MKKNLLLATACVAGLITIGVAQFPSNNSASTGEVNLILDTVPNKDTTPVKDTTPGDDSSESVSFNSLNSYMAKDTVPKKDTTPSPSDSSSLKP
jgi:hypothetical protein